MSGQTGKRRLDLLAAAIEPGRQRSLDHLVGEVWPVERRPAMSGPCLLIAAAGRAAEADADRLARVVLAAASDRASASAGSWVFQESRPLCLDLLQSKPADQPAIDSWSTAERSAVADRLERSWDGRGWWMVRGIDLLAVRRVTCSVVVQAGVMDRERYPLMRALGDIWDLSINDATERLGVALAERFLSRAGLISFPRAV